MPAPPVGPGALMRAEMGEQPAVLHRMASEFDSHVAAVRALAGDGVRGVAFLARGSSDHAALLGRYAVELYAGAPTSLMAPSLTTSYAHRPSQLDGWLLVALSQSGRTPEIVDVARQSAAAGARVVALTNDAESDLATAADLTIALGAGPELAVPATKTVTAQMLAALVVAAGLAQPGASISAPDVASLGATVEALLADDGPTERVALALARYDRMAVVGRGFCYPAAMETALKVQETTGVMAHGFSTADFRHGPIAVCGPGAPGVLLAGSGPTDEDTRSLRADLEARGAETAVIGTESDADVSWPAAGSTSGSAVEAILATVRGQQLALQLSLARGVDPDHPAGLNKVTLTH